jgi:ATP-dependent helicase Lhr and Lhr-like helicase
VRTQEMTAYVKKAEKSRGLITTWGGAKMPLSTELADATLEVLEQAAEGRYDEPELVAAEPMLRTQATMSKLPTRATLLVEHLKSREGQHVFIYPFAGRNVHIGLASLLAWRLARDAPNTFSLSINDYGLEMLSALPIDLSAIAEGRLFEEGDLLHDVLASLNSSQLARQRFREIARIAGLVFTGYPGQPKSARQLQASSTLFYEVFSKYDAGNLLLTQAQTEVLNQELDIRHLSATLARMRGQRVEVAELAAPSPFSLALMVERFREKLTTEKLADRLERILKDAERVADNAANDHPAPKRRRGARK